MDDIERRVRDANPSPVRRDSPLTDRAERDLTAILHTSRAVTPPRRRTHGVTVVAAIAAVFAIVVALTLTNSFLTRSPAVAAPPRLVATPVAESLGDTLTRLGTLARSNPPAPSSTSTTISSETWSADVTARPDRTSAFVQPTEVVRTRSDDLSGSVVVHAGTVRWGAVPGGDIAPTPGAEVDSTAFEAGAYPLLFASSPPAVAGDLRDYLADYLGSSTTASTGDYFRAVQDLRNDWQLDGAQTAALLAVIATLPDVELMGQVTDRLGRPGIAIATTTRSAGAFSDVLIFDDRTGLLLSAEDVYLGGIDDITLDHPSVLGYTAWKEQT